MRGEGISGVREAGSHRIAKIGGLFRGDADIEIIVTIFCDT